MRAIFLLTLCLPLLAEEIAIDDIKAGDCLRVEVTGKTVRIPCPDGKAGDLAYAQAQIAALQAQLRYELAGCWNLETMGARYEAAKAAKDAEALKPKPEPEPKKK